MFGTRRRTAFAAGLCFGVGVMTVASEQARSLTIHSEQLMTTDNRLAVGIPQNNAAFWDGSNYWLFRGDGDQLLASYGPTLADLAPTPTALNGTDNIGRMENDVTFSLAFGTQDGVWHAWALANRSPASGDGETYSLYRWRLADTGLADPAARFVEMGDKPTPSQVYLTPGIGGFEIQDLYGTIATGSDSQQESWVYPRRFAPDFSADTGFGKVSAEGVNFPEASPVFEVHNGNDDRGWILNQVNIGDAGESSRPNAFSEWRRTTAEAGAEHWSAEMKLEGTAPEDWGDMNYAVDRGTSHTGQNDFVQLADGTIFHAYADGLDTENGLFGNLVLKRRNSALDADWGTVSAGAVPDGSAVWHVSLTSDGEDVYILYVKSADNTPGATERQDAIHLLRYDPDTDTFSDETAIAEMNEGLRFDRMTTQWRFHDKRLVVFWSETDAGVFRDEHEGKTWYAHVTAVTIPEASTGILLGLGTTVLLRRRPRRHY